MLSQRHFCHWPKRLSSFQAQEYTQLIITHVSTPFKHGWQLVISKTYCRQFGLTFLRGCVQEWHHHSGSVLSMFTEAMCTNSTLQHDTTVSTLLIWLITK